MVGGVRGPVGSELHAFQKLAAGDKESLGELSPKARKGLKRSLNVLRKCSTPEARKAQLGKIDKIFEGSTSKGTGSFKSTKVASGFFSRLWGRLPSPVKRIKAYMAKRDLSQLAKLQQVVARQIAPGMAGEVKGEIARVNKYLEEAGAEKKVLEDSKKMLEEEGEQLQEGLKDLKAELARVESRGGDELDRLKDENTAQREIIEAAKKDIKELEKKEVSSQPTRFKKGKKKVQQRVGKFAKFAKGKLRREKAGLEGSEKYIPLDESVEGSQNTADVIKSKNRRIQDAKSTIKKNESKISKIEQEIPGNKKKLEDFLVQHKKLEDDLASKKEQIIQSMSELKNLELEVTEAEWELSGLQSLANQIAAVSAGKAEKATPAASAKPAQPTRAAPPEKQAATEPVEIPRDEGDIKLQKLKKTQSRVEFLIRKYGNITQNKGKIDIPAGISEKLTQLGADRTSILEEFDKQRDKMGEARNKLKEIDRQKEPAKHQAAIDSIMEESNKLTEASAKIREANHEILKELKRVKLSLSGETSEQ